MIFKSFIPILNRDVPAFGPRMLMLLAGGLSVFWLCSCRTPRNDEEWNKRMDAVMLAKAPADNSFWSDRLISAEGRTEQAATYAGRRTAMLSHNIEITEKPGA